METHNTATAKIAASEEAVSSWLRGLDRPTRERIAYLLDAVWSANDAVFRGILTLVLHPEAAVVSEPPEGSEKVN